MQARAFERGAGERTFKNQGEGGSGEPRELCRNCFVGTIDTGPLLFSRALILYLYIEYLHTEYFFSSPISPFNCCNRCSVQCAHPCYGYSFTVNVNRIAALFISPLVPLDAPPPPPPPPQVY